MTIKNFRASDFSGSEKPARLLASKHDRYEAPKPTSEPVIAPEASEDDVPSGTVPEVLTWVGDDVERAQKALDEEVANDKPRKGLVAQLQEMIDAEAAEEDAEEGHE